MKIIATDNAPGAIGPYSQAITAHGLVYTSGQIPIDPATGEIVSGGIEAQARQVFENIGAILDAAGSSLDRVIKTTCFLADMGDFQTFNEIYAAYIKRCPARSCVAVKTLPKNVLVEVEVIADTNEE